jgi:hypothetical protein
MLWVAGVPTTASIVSAATGTATYTGQVVADINNRGVFYIVAGTFSNAVNFGTQTGAVTITGLDGANYAGNVTLTPSSTLFATLSPLTSSIITGRAATINGSFFQGATSPIGEMGGSITLTGTHYLGSGIFAAGKL